MSGRILQVNFTFNMSTAEYEETVAPLAKEIAAVSGLLWKVWLLNAETKEAGGIYLFAGKASAKAYLEGPIVQGLASHPQIYDIAVKQFDTLPELTQITQGPVTATT